MRALKIFAPWESSEFALAMRLALLMALLSVHFEKLQDVHRYVNTRQWLLVICVVLGTIALPFIASARYGRVAVVCFCLFMLPGIFYSWSSYANHGWLAVWTIPISLIFARWWESDAYSTYIRFTLGVVMLAAALQKLVAGTYLDGSYIAYLSYHGGLTETLFRSLCTVETLNDPCGWHQFLGTFIVLWQIGVGLLLLLGVTGILFLCVEVGFLIGAGIFADEMNFQVLNIALLCMAFRVGMPRWLFALCFVFLIIDMRGIGSYLRLIGI